MRWTIFCVVLGAICLVAAYVWAFCYYSRFEMRYRQEVTWMVGACLIGLLIFTVTAAVMGVRPRD